MRYAFDIPKFVEWVVETWAPVHVQAEQAAYSRSHFSRLFARDVGETPFELKRRLQLEAAAHLLGKSGFRIGEIAVEVGYETPEAFTKAFRKAYGTNPRAFRNSPPVSSWLEAKSRIHFHPSGLIVRRQGEKQLKLSQILLRQHVDEISRLLKETAALPDEKLDAELIPQGDAIPWDKHERTLRGTLRSIIVTHLLWLAAFRGEPLPENMPERPSLEELVRRHEESGSRPS
jgi:AraC family transcriptional regulator